MGADIVRKWNIVWEDALLKEGCPPIARCILPLVEDACDEIDYAGSRMYDEIPDRHMMRRLSEKVCARAAKELAQAENGRCGKNPAELYVDDDIFATDDAVGTGGEELHPYARALVETMLGHELFSRRCARHIRQGGVA